MIVDDTLPVVLNAEQGSVRVVQVLVNLEETVGERFQSVEEGKHTHLV